MDTRSASEPTAGKPPVPPAALSRANSALRRPEEKKFKTSIWNNPLSPWQTPGTINDRLKRFYFSYMLNERQLCHLITDGLKAEKPAPFDNKPAPGAVGLVRSLDLKCFDSNNELVGHLDHEASTHRRLNMLQVDDVEQIVTAGKRYFVSSDDQRSEFRRNLYSLLRRTELLSANVDVNSLVLTKEIVGSKFSGSIKGKLGSDAPVKKFTFHAEEFTKMICKVPGSTFSLTVGFNRTDLTAFIRLKPVAAVSMDFIQYVNEMFIVFNKKPRCSMHVVKHPKSLTGKSYDTGAFLFGTKSVADIMNDGRNDTNTAPSENERSYNDAMQTEVEAIKKTPDIIGPETKLLDGYSKTMYFLNKVVPLVRYVQREKGGTGSRIGQLKYEDYLPHFALFTHDLARLQYTYTVLYSVASALWREVFNHDEACSWPYLIECIKHFVGTFSESMVGAVQTKTNPWNLKSEIALTAVLVSKLYEEAMKKNHDTTANAIETKAQLQRLYTARCELSSDQGDRHLSDFGHLLATYAFETSPLHIISNMDVRNDESETRTKYGKHQKLYIMKLNTSDDHVRKNHLKRWSLNLVAGSRRIFYFDLQGIMDPTNGVPRNPETPTKYWRRDYNLSNEIEDQYKKKDDALISVILDSTHEFSLHMDVFHTNILGVELKDNVEVKKGK